MREVFLLTKIVGEYSGSCAKGIIADIEMRDILESLKTSGDRRSNGCVAQVEMREIWGQDSERVNDSARVTP